jgi:hypothetical protein
MIPFITLRVIKDQKGSKVRRLVLLLLVLTVLLGGCGVQKNIDHVINEIEDTTLAIESISDAWRDQLPLLLADLHGLESEVDSDIKGVVTDTANQVQDLVSQTIQLTDAKAQDLIAQAGVEFRCNSDFVKKSVIEQLQYLVENLKFWKQNMTYLTDKPNHAICWINPTVLSLYPIGNGWSIDTSNMSDPNIVRVIGYNFRSDALPNLELQAANGDKIRDIRLNATYVTQYQINLDFSTEDFAGAEPGTTIVFRWPDQDDPNALNVILLAPAKLTISNPVFTPAVPTEQQDSVTLKVTITNVGDVRSGNFDVIWKPDPNDTQLFTVSHLPLNAEQTVDVAFPIGYVYQQGGILNSTVSLNTGDDTQIYPLAVAPAPPVPLPIQEYLNQLETVTNPNIPGIGHGQDVEYGGACHHGYVRADYNVIVESTTGDAGAWANGWVEPDNNKSCALSVHYSLAANGLFGSTSEMVRIIIYEKGE